MAALPYMQFFPAEYLADTGHLLTEEHGAYFLLILNYWQTGKKLRKDRLANIARLSNDRWILVEESLKEFFIDDGEYWIHCRIEADLQIVHDSVAQASKAGKASAAARKIKKQSELKKSIGKSTTVTTTVTTNDGTEGPTEAQLEPNEVDVDVDVDVDVNNSSSSTEGESIPKTLGLSSDMFSDAKNAFHELFGKKTAALIDIDIEFQKFKDHYLTSGLGCHDWQAQWRNWCSNDNTVTRIKREFKSGF